MAKYFTLTVVGCWCALMSFGYGRAEQWRPHPPVHTVAARQAVEPVRLWSDSQEGYDLTDIARLNKLAARKPSQSERAAAEQEYAEAEHVRCGDDFACLLAWAERRRNGGRP